MLIRISGLNLKRQPYLRQPGPEVKNALESMRALYEEGIIDKEFATKDATQYNQDLISGKVGITYNWLGFALSINDMKKLNPEAEFKAYEIVSVDEEEALPQANATVDFWYVVRKGYEHPEALIKMANLEIATLITSEAKDQAPDGTTNSEYYGAPKDAPSMFDVVNFWFSLVPDENSTRYDVYEAVMKRDPSNVRSNDLSIYENLIAYEEGTWRSGAGTEPLEALTEVQRSHRNTKRRTS